MKRVFSGSRLLLAAGMLLASGPAYAWEHIGNVWCEPDDMPIPYYLSDYVEDSVPEGYPAIAIQNGYDTWTREAPCAGVGGTYVGVADNTPFREDGTNRHSFDDPGDELGAGIRAAALNQIGSGQTCFEQDGTLYDKITDADIVWNDNVDFATEEQIASGTCEDEASMQSTATHEIGHTLGLDHSCENGDPCLEQDLREATMYWTGPQCDNARASINVDDIEGINALYGPYATIECSNELDPDDPDTLAFGNVPFELRCRVISKSRVEVTDVTWQWGDGETSTGLDAVHTYNTAGNFSLQATINGQNPTCGGWDYTARKVSYVRACAVPTADFTWAHVDGLTYQLRNETDLSVYGCVYDVRWDIFRGDELIDTLRAWEPNYTFPKKGDYRVVLNVGGPAGTGAAELKIAAENQRGEGYGACDQSTGSGAGASLAIAGLLSVLARRNRR